MLGSFMGAVVVYALLGLAFFYVIHHYVSSEKKPKEKIITFSLVQYKPDTIPVMEPIVEPPEELKPITKPEIKEIEPPPLPVLEDKIISKKFIKKKPRKMKTVAKKVVKKKVVKKKVIKKKYKKKKLVKKRPSKRKVSTKKVSNKKRTRNKQANKKQTSQKQTNPAKKNAFLSRIRSKIDRNKIYPRIARRRGMQGYVKVRFTILRNGHVSNIVTSGKKIFYKSARRAIEKAFPVNAKKAPLSLPAVINLTLRYQIR